MMVFYFSGKAKDDDLVGDKCMRLNCFIVLLLYLQGLFAYNNNNIQQQTPLKNDLETSTMLLQ